MVSYFKHAHAVEFFYSYVHWLFVELNNLRFTLSKVDIFLKGGSIKIGHG